MTRGIPTSPRTRRSIRMDSRFRGNDDSRESLRGNDDSRESSLSRARRSSRVLACAGTTPPRRQRGVALIIAVLIVALATMLAASVSFKGYLDQRRSANTFAMDQGYEVALGGEAWAADSLRRDKQQSSKTDDFTEEWATPIPPIPIDNGQFEGQLEDMQGRFNLNSLVMQGGQGGQLIEDEAALKRFERLLELLELETKWAKIITDWIDTDIQPGFPDARKIRPTPASRRPTALPTCR
jgi:type II secretory pathway component PulK